MKKRFTTVKSTSKRIIVTALIVISLLTLSVPAFAKTGIKVGETAFVTQAEARLRNEPNLDANIIDRLNCGTNVKIVATTNTYHGWYKVDTGVSRGYIREDFLEKLTKDNPGYNVSYYGPMNKNFKKGDKVVSYLSYIRDDLVKCGYSLSKKKFDTGWEKAVKDFQKKHALTPDGIIGRQTKRALWRATHSN